MATNRKLIRSTSIISSAITSSRLLGFFRDILFARFFGTGIFAQAFVVAYRLPNILRDLIGEGATDAVIVPVLSELKHTTSDERYWEGARSILSALVMLLFIVTFLGVLAAPLIVRLIAPGFLDDPQLYSTAVVLTRMLFPFVFFLGLTAYSKGVLNSLNYFTTPALASVVLNASIIVSLWTLRDTMGINCMVVGVLTGGVLQILIQVPPMLSRGFSFKGGWSVLHSVNARIGKLLLPRVLGTAVYQLSILVDTMLASLAWIVGPGAPAALYFSNRLVQLPLAVFGISLVTAALPKMSREFALEHIGRFKETVRFSLNTVFMVMVPAALGLMVLSGPIVRILFQRGQFTEYSTQITMTALFFYSFGLTAYAGIKVLVSAFYSMGDTRTPVKTAAISLGINIVLNLILMWPLKIGGLALATSIAATSNFFILYRHLSRKLGSMGGSEIFRALKSVTGATLGMTVVTYIMARALLYSAGNGLLWQVGSLVLTIFVSGIAYLCLGYLFGVEGIRKLFDLVRRRIIAQKRNDL